MASRYASHLSTAKTPQSQAVVGKAMVQNSAGGYTFQVSDWKLLERFLILGQEGPTYYASEHKIVVDNAKCILRCAAEDAAKTVRTIVEISKNGRAPKNDPAIFALALLAGQKGEVARLALEAVPEVCRIGTHLFQFMGAVREFRGFGPALRRALGNWYLSKTPEQVAFQITKYQQRDGWSHRDVLRLAHPVASDHAMNQVLRYAVGKPSETSAPAIVGFEKIKVAKSAKEAALLIEEFGLPRECVPTHYLNDLEVWEALMQRMPTTAMVRNLGKMTSIGLIKPLSKSTDKVCESLRDVEALKRAKIHPLQILMAQRTYAQGHGDKGKLRWSPDQQIVQALDDAFTLAFDAVVPAGKRFLLALDVSASMSWPTSTIAGTCLTARDASAAMALVTMRTEPKTHLVGFHSGATSLSGYGRSRLGIQLAITPIDITPKQNLQSVIQTVSRLPAGGTDCALPMIYAQQHNLEVDTFVVLTDNETWAGNVHPFQALKDYRKASGINAQLVVVGMVANSFTIADPSDFGMLDVVGFDSATPALISDFARG